MDAVLLPAAFGLGAFHALEPGHGKTLVTAYLVGNEGRKRDALLLGAMIAVCHTASVLIVAMIAAWAIGSVINVKESMFQWAEILSGVLIMAVGGLMLWRSLGREVTEPACATGHHDHCTHDELAQTLTQKGMRRSSLKEILLLGLASGLCPSPLPLVLLISALVAGELTDLSTVAAYILTFSVGLACVVMAIGLVLIAGRKQSMQWIQSRFSGEGVSSGAPWLRHVPRVLSVVSAILIVGLGVYLIVQGVAAPSESGNLSSHIFHTH